jgi:ElaB/YqjD/DUF883 family membrane-anchored ribosome-binding protein
MDTRQDCSVDELRRRSEATRAALALTVGELRDKVEGTASDLKTVMSPSNIKQEIKTYIRDERESLLQTLERKAKDNPLQAAAVGAAIAYPAWGLLRAIPAPLLLIGAGLWLTSAKGRQTLNQVQDKAADALEQGTAKASEYADTLKEELTDYTDSLKDELSKRSSTVMRTLSDTGEAIKGKASEVADQARATMHDVRDAVAEKTGMAARGVQDAASESTGAISRSVSDAKDRVTQAAQSSQSAVMDFVEKNPLLVAGIGAAVGAFIAASLPSSRAENALLGKGSDGLKDKARDAAAQGLERAKDLAAGVASDVAGSVAREGLDTSGAGKAVDSITKGLKAVAERGVETAISGTRRASSSEQR